MKSVHSIIGDILIRKAKKRDLMNVFCLSNDPIVRKNSYHSKMITLEEHRVWFKDKLDNILSYFFVLYHKNDSFVGYVRYERIGISRRFVCTIHISSKYRNKGIGTWAISQTLIMLARKERPMEIIASAKIYNKASQNIFKKNSFIFRRKLILEGKKSVEFIYRDLKLSYWGNFYTISKSVHFPYIKYSAHEANKINKILERNLSSNNIRRYEVSSKDNILDVIHNEERVDLTIVGNFGIIFPKEAILYLKRKIVNIHPGILPFYRGRHPLPQAIQNKEKEMGVTVHILTPNIDAGKIISIKRTNISYDKSYKYNEAKLLAYIPQLINEVVEKLLDGSLVFSKVEYRDGDYYKRLDKVVLHKIIQSKNLSNIYI